MILQNGHILEYLSRSYLLRKVSFIFLSLSLTLFLLHHHNNHAAAAAAAAVISSDNEFNLLFVESE